MYILFHIYFDNNLSKQVVFQSTHILIQLMVCHIQNNKNVEHGRYVLRQLYTLSKILTRNKNYNQMIAIELKRKL